ncbi:MAG: glycosyltransferase [Acidimicrobiia bacterium]|nr:glycosyltransferase [Acidimicrobiia bacterium]
MDESERLRIEVQDERARRRWAERELAAESEKRALWRKRAEDRATRIKLLEERLARPPQRQSVVGRLKRLLRRVESSPTREDSVPIEPTAAPIELPATPSETAGDEDRRRRPTFPTVRVATLGAAPSFMQEFETVDIAANENALYDSDFVFANADSMAADGDSVITPIRQWLELPARQPLVLWTDDSAKLPTAEWVATADHHLSPRLLHAQLFPDLSDGELFAETIAGEPLDHYEAMTLMAGGMPAFKPGESGPEDDERLAVVARRLAWRQASPEALARQLLEVVEIDVPARSYQIGALLVSNKPDLVATAVERLLRQKNVELLPVVGLHGDSTLFEEARRQIEDMLDGSPGVILSIDGGLPLGKALNIAAASCTSPFLAKIDDDDWYGDHYLEEALYAAQRTGADVVGKACYYVEFEESQEVYQVAGAEDAFTKHVIGSSLFFSRRLWEEMPFPHRPSRVDSIFLRGARVGGRAIYSTSRFDFAVRRRASGHTWEVDPARFAAQGRKVAGSLADACIEASDALLGWADPPAG